MTDAATLEKPQTSIVALVEANPVMVLTDREKFSRFYEEIKRETDALDADVTTERGRKAIASMAYKVARTKTAIDEAGKKLNEEARARINAVDESRREIRAQLDTLKDEVRRPLTEWEAAEEVRVEACTKTLQLLRDSANVGFDETAAQVRGRLGAVEAMPIDPVTFDGYLPQAMALKEQAVIALTSAAERMEREEAERAELEKLRAEAAEREAREAAEREAKERAERERIAAEEAERQRAAAAEAEAQRIRDAEERAAQAAREEAARQAREAEEARQREHEAALAAERQQREEAERRERERKQEEERAAAEKARREADQQHRSTIMRAAKEAIMESGEVDEPAAKRIVLAIAAGNVPAVAITF
jgi:colicin import membrane protein